MSLQLPGIDRPVTESVAAVRANRDQRWVALAAAGTVGSVAATVHWVGLVLGGVLIGVFASRLRWALVGGAAFGLLFWLFFLVTMAGQGMLGLYLDTGQLLYVSAAIPVAAGLFGSLARAAI
jgi:hypothetical protein